MAKTTTPAALRWNRPVTRSTGRLTKTMSPIREVDSLTSKCGRVSIKRVSASDFGAWVDGVRTARRHFPTLLAAKTAAMLAA